MASALGLHADPGRSLTFAPERLCTVQGVGHLGLLSHPEVYTQLHRWLA